MLCMLIDDLGFVDNSIYSYTKTKVSINIVNIGM